MSNFRQFQQSVAAQGLQMLCVELTFGEESFQLRPDDCDILLQRRTAAGNTLSNPGPNPDPNPDT